jgi:predicted RNase H-like HicB family nuclease
MLYNEPILLAMLSRSIPRAFFNNMAIYNLMNVPLLRFQYIAHATPIDVMSSGPTPEDAKKAVNEAVHLFLETIKEMGTLEEVLSECGYDHCI